MKKYLPFIFIGIFNLQIIFSQEQKTDYTPEERANYQTNWMKENLDLSDEQSQKVAALNLVYANKMEKVKTLSGNKEKFERAKAIQAEKDKKISEILNKKQYEKYIDKKKELRKEMMKHRKEIL